MRRAHWVVQLLLLCSLPLSPAVRADPLPVEIYAALPAADNVRLSPDGLQVAMMSPKAGQLAVKIWHPDGKVDWLVPTRADQLSWICWKGDDRLLLGLRFTGHAGQGVPVAETRLLIASVADQAQVPVTFIAPQSPPDVRIVRRDMYHPPHLQDRLISALPNDSDHVLLAASQQDWHHPWVMRVDTHHGLSLPFLYPTGNVVRWLADPGGAVRLAVAVDSRAEHGFDLVVRVRDAEQGDWHIIHRAQIDRDPRFIPLAFASGSPSTLFVLVDQDNGRLALRSFDTKSLVIGPVLAADPECDIEPVMRDNRLLGYINPCRGPVETYLERGWQQDQALLKQFLQVDDVALIDRSADGGVVLARSSSTVAAPPLYWYFDRSRAGGTLTLIADSNPGMTADHVAPVRRVSYRARDGQTIPALLTLPPDPTGRPIGFVVLPHGGPAAHDSEEWDWLVQSIAGRGYGVLQPQFRGSSGHGAEFQRAGYGEWGGRMQDDVNDARNWLIATRLADPEHLCIVGVSYGGYAALMGAAQQPGLYRCAVAIAPVTDLTQLIGQQLFTEFGDVNRDRIIGTQSGESLRSPLDQADNFTVPVLLIHGRQDYTVPVSHSEALERRLRAAGRSVRALYLDRADHFFGRYEDRLDCLRALDSFLATYLGGAAPPAPS